MTLKMKIMMWSLITAIGVFLVIVFWPIVFEDIIYPISMVSWLFLRLFVLSFDQLIFWLILTIGFVFLLVRRLSFLFEPPEINETKVENEAMVKLERWQNLFYQPFNNSYEQNFLKDKLIDLLVTLFSSNEQNATNYLTLEALKQGTIVLPQNIYQFLFVRKKVEKKNPILRFFINFRDSLQNWFNGITGRTEREYHAMINDVLSFIESSLEMPLEENEIFTAKLL